MPLLNTATKVYKGPSLASKVYRGTVQVWPPAAAWGPNQSAYTTQTPTTSTVVGAIAAGNDVQFAVAGRIVGLRYYRDAASVSTSKTMRVWSSGGVELGNAATAGDSGSGWKAATLATPIAVTAGQVVRLALEIPNETIARWNSPATDIVNGDLTLIKQGYNGTPDLYPTSPVSRGYFVDLIFQKAL